MREDKKLYSKSAMSLATFIGGPWAAGYLVSKNYRVFNEPKRGRIAFVFGIVFTLLLMLIGFLLPEKIGGGAMLIPILSVAVVRFFVDKYQGVHLKQHIQEDGSFYSLWRATGVGVVSFVSIIFVVLGITFFSGDLSEPNYDTEIYNQKISRFIENEKQSLKVYDVVSTAEPKYLKQQFTIGIILWLENQEIVNSLNTIENLPKGLVEKNNILLKYCELRLNLCKAHIRALTDESVENNDDIKRIGEKIDMLLRD